jgi:RHS repeat-associated protein
LYFPFGECRNSTGTLPTDKLFTGQRLDGTGLYFYGGRYYDSSIGRFISADTFTQWSTDCDIVSDPLTVNAIPAGLGSVTSPQGNYPSFTPQAPVNPQNLNRYSYVRNNPLAYTDPTGWWTWGLHFSMDFTLGFSVNIGVSFNWDNHGNWALTSDSPGLAGSNSVSASINFGASTTSADTIYDLFNETTYTADLAIWEGIMPDPGLIFDDNGLTGGSFTLGFGEQFPTPNLTMGVSEPPADIIISNQMLENYSPQNFFYDMTNTFISPEDAYYFDYYWDGYMDYGYNYDAYYYDYYGY